MSVVSFPKQLVQEQEAPEILTREQLAEYCKVSTRTVDRWVQDGMPSEMWGKRLRRFRLQAVDLWLRRRAS
jgi:excisionase family DNA binding protein